jgi:DNA (cytosine-5)-methyltransferase 1
MCDELVTEMTLDSIIESLNKLSPDRRSELIDHAVVELTEICYIEDDLDIDRRKNPGGDNYHAIAIIDGLLYIIYKYAVITAEGSVTSTPRGRASQRSYIYVLVNETVNPVTKKKFTDKQKSVLVNGSVIHHIHPLINKHKGVKWCQLTDENLKDIQDKLDTSPPKKIKFIDLFCGLGAFHEAFPSHDFECVLACDINEKVRHIYKDNYGIEPEGDIRDIDIGTMPEFDLLCAGFPCQPFSIAGNGEGFSDTTKGNLFFDILKIIDKKKPPMCILENVKNLGTHDNGNTYKRIQTELEKRGYTVISKVLNSAEYGSPQARKRIFIVATKGGEFIVPGGSRNFKPVSEIINPDVIQSDINMIKYNIVEKKSKLIPGRPHLISTLHSKKTGKGGRQGERIYSTDSVGITVCASSGGPGAKTGVYKINDVIRRLTVSETLKMFGFPETYKLQNTSDEEARFFLGNSIVVSVPSAFVPHVKDWFKTMV